MSALEPIKPYPLEPEIEPKQFVIKRLINTIESSNYQCEAGALVNDRNWKALKRMLQE